MDIVIGGVYRHCHGLRYRVRELIMDATGYEATGKVQPAVVYEQLDDGHYPAGTVWVRTQTDFLGHSSVDGASVPTFSLEAE